MTEHLRVGNRVSRLMGLVVLVALSLLVAVPSWAAAGSYDEADPFDELRRVERLKTLGWDFSQELDVELQFGFSDQKEFREHHAQRFAMKLRRLGYPQATAKPCAKADLCWLVAVPHKLRIDPKKLVAMSKEYDQMAADEYGRYEGWDCELFRVQDEKMRESALASLKPTPEGFLSALGYAFSMQCMRIAESAEREARNFEAAGKAYEAGALLSLRDLICSCAPNRVRELQMALLPDERNLTLTEEQFTQRYALPKVLHPCVAQLVRKTYVEDCPKLAAKLPVNAPAYCACLQSALGELTEAEMTQLGLEAADYIPKAAQAQKEGRASPEPPELYRKFTESEASCRKSGGRLGRGGGRASSGDPDGPRTGQLRDASGMRPSR